MLNIFPTLGKVTQDVVTLSHSYEGEIYTVEYKTCKDVLEVCLIVAKYAENFQGTAYDYYKENFEACITFNNSEDVLEITCLEHLKELAEHC